MGLHCLANNLLFSSHPIPDPNNYMQSKFEVQLNAVHAMGKFGKAGCRDCKTGCFAMIGVFSESETVDVIASGGCRTLCTYHSWFAGLWSEQVGGSSSGLACRP